MHATHRKKRFSDKILSDIKKGFKNNFLSEVVDVPLTLLSHYVCNYVRNFVLKEKINTLHTFYQIVPPPPLMLALSYRKYQLTAYLEIKNILTRVIRNVFLPKTNFLKALKFFQTRYRARLRTLLSMPRHLLRLSEIKENILIHLFKSWRCYYQADGFYFHGRKRKEKSKST